ncbi:elongation factor G [bacterium]|nr:elongation factor G [bacterium]NIN91793.1 elongation factor G [bacterium]NIO18081.1 elongation factor G [bacterium]NIO73046.1 elongation factor G [bacterium]
MKKYKTEDLRNISIVGSGSTGKTQLAEAILFSAKAIDRLGKVDSGNTVCDYNADEIDRKISINSSIAFCEWKDKKINIIDTPGYADFVGEVMGALSVVETSIVNVCASSGVEMGTEKKWEYVQKNEKPSIIFVNRMDKENADFDKVEKSLKEKLTPNVAPISIPIGSGSEFSGVINLITNRGMVKGKEVEIPEEMVTKTKEYREKLIEVIASSEDTLIEKYLEGQELSPEETRRALKKGIVEHKIVPVLCGSGLQNIGIDQLLDFVVEYAPSPVEVEGEVKIEPNGPFSALVFKTFSEPHLGIINYLKIYSGKISAGSNVINDTKSSSEKLGQIGFVRGKTRIEVKEAEAGDIIALVKLKGTGVNDVLCDPKNKVSLPRINFPEPMVDMAVYPKSKGEEEKIAKALSTANLEDPTLKFEMNKETKEMILSGMGSLQLEVMSRRVKARYGVEVEFRRPKIAYRETIRATADVQGKYKRQSGGRGQYGDCWLKTEPLERGKGFEFVNKIFGGAIPSQYIPAVEKGIKQSMEKGVISGYPVVDVRVTLYDGTFHEVDSSNLAFEIAGSMALRKGVEQAQPFILEPIMEVEAIVPEEFMGSVMGDLNSRRGRVLGMERDGKKQVIKALVPQGELFNYATDLRSLTKGSGEHKMKFSHYEEAPPNVTQPLIEAYQKAKEEGR